MNIEALKKVVPHLSVLTVVPTNIAMNLNRTFGPKQAEEALTNQREHETFSRFRWRPLGSGCADAPPGDIISAKCLMGVMVDTLVEIAIQPGSGPIPESEEIPDELSLAKIEVTFALNYASDVPSNELDGEGVEAFVQNNVPYHFWPYWRELVQNLAMRAQLPIPNLPAYRVPTAGQGK